MITYYKNEAYTIKNVAGANKTQYLIDIACKSTDTKPTVDIVTGSTAIEVNTGKRYIFDEESGDWTEVDSGGGGGGGSSDFSTAEVTVQTDSADKSCNLWIPRLIGYDARGGINVYSEPETLTVILYDGMCIAEVSDTVGVSRATQSGDIVQPETFLFEITGDGTITFS